MSADHQYYVVWKIIETGQVKQTEGTFPKVIAEKIANWWNKGGKLSAWIEKV